MNRSGYTDCYGEPYYWSYRATVARCIKSNRGQRFLICLLDLLDAMPGKRLIANELIDSDGDCCTLGVVYKAHGIDHSVVDYEDAISVAKPLDISHQLASEIESENDQDFSFTKESPESRWVRMRRWVDRNIKKEPAARTEEDPGGSA